MKKILNNKKIYLRNYKKKMKQSNNNQKNRNI